MVYHTSGCQTFYVLVKFQCYRSDNYWVMGKETTTTLVCPLYMECFIPKACMIHISDCGVNGNNLPLERHAANEYGGWVKIVKWFRLSHKPVGLASVESVTV